MKIFNLFFMAIFISGLLVSACTPNVTRVKEIETDAHVTIQDSTRVYTFTIYAKDWQTLNTMERAVDVKIEDLSEDIIRQGYVAVFLSEANKYQALPFNYYQVRKILSFQPSFAPGHIYISIFGNFILNVNAQYNFKAVLVSPKEFKKHKTLNWRNYEKVKEALKIHD